MPLSTLTRRLTYANVTSTACLFILLGGSAYAATAITGSDVRNGSLTSADVRDHSLRARDFKAGELPRGPKGDPEPARQRPAKGDSGPAGPQGEPGPAGKVSPPAASREPVGRLVLPGIAGDGPQGAIEVRGLAWSNVLSGDAATGGGATGQGAVGRRRGREGPRSQLRAALEAGRHRAAAGHGQARAAGARRAIALRDLLPEGRQGGELLHAGVGRGAPGRGGAALRSRRAAEPGLRVRRRRAAAGAERAARGPHDRRRHPGRGRPACWTRGTSAWPTPRCSGRSW